ncbi:helix-turn-helix transcriptional regulator [Bernardetia sp. MNP-M8]|uniref:helix-turn-helix domain-containing protein n=1 Tax=Bernardetia sp. MNP-M8 TaxID=3127470 RepID=UPI0030CCD058
MNIDDFYKCTSYPIPPSLRYEVGHFNVFKIDEFSGENSKPIPYNRRNYYKVSVIIGKNRVHYADKTFEAEHNTLLFASPHIPYDWNPLTENLSGFFCVFTEEFFHNYGNIKDYPVFNPSGNSVFSISDEDVKAFSLIYDKMFKEINSDYEYKYDVLRSLVLEIVHKAIRMYPAQKTEVHTNAAMRISNLFLELLERQFPIEDTFQKINFKTPSDFANQLAIHVNYLNKTLKETTQMTTSELIAKRVLQEAKIILKHTKWNISEIAFSLGFEETTHFNNFFKKHLHQTPTQFRNS